jgi:starch synthase (maltosyl-transferring)
MTTTKQSTRRAVARILEAREGERDGPEPGPDAIGTRRSIVVERIQPELDGGRHPVKRVVGDRLMVSADIFADGHDLIDAALLLRPDGAASWREAPMRLVENDRWSASIELTENRWHRYAVEAWRDAFGTWRHGLERKVEAGVPVPVEIEEGRLLLEAALARAQAARARKDATTIGTALAALRRARSPATRVAILAAEDLLAVARRHPERRFATRSAELPLVVDRERARFGAWYELFPRSQGRDPKRPKATTFREAEWRLPDIRAMGFDVVYVPPIHPIGRTNRKGRNNTLDARPDDVGSPYGIGSADGGHDTVAPELGGLKEFVHFREAV